MNTSVAAQWCRDVDNSHVLSAGIPQADNGKPVVALIGAYSAGKTSLIRRLLHERGLACPDGLSVASDPTTFEPLDVDAGFAVLRDTPGLGSGKELHNSRAVQAAVEADALALIMTPQLLSGADADAWDLVTGAAWGRGEAADDAPGLLLVINRFDMAGPDPESELDAYLMLAERKQAELRSSLASRGVRTNVPILVTASDPYGLAADSCAVAHDEGAGWDGLPQLLAALVESSTRLPELRAARNVRVRGRALMVRQQELSTALQDLERTEAAAALRKHHAESHRRELARVWQRAEAEREELLREAIGLDAVAAATPDRASLLRRRIEQTLDSWSQGLEDRLKAYAQASPKGQLVDEPPPADMTRMPSLDPLEDLGDPLTEALKALRDNAAHVKATADAFRALGETFPSLARLKEVASPEVVDAAVGAATLWLNVTAAEDRAVHEAAVAQRDHFMELATKQSDLAIGELRSWSESDGAAYEALCRQIAAELEVVTTAIKASRRDLDTIKCHLRSMPV